MVADFAFVDPRDEDRPSRPPARTAGDGGALSRPHPRNGVDGTAVGGCLFHDPCPATPGAAAIASGLCDTVLITHGESGRSGVGRTRNVVAPTSPRRPVAQPL